MSNNWGAWDGVDISAALSSKRTLHSGLLTDKGNKTKECRTPGTRETQKMQKPHNDVLQTRHSKCFLGLFFAESRVRDEPTGYSCLVAAGLRRLGLGVLASLHVRPMETQKYEHGR